MISFSTAISTQPSCDGLEVAAWNLSGNVRRHFANYRKTGNARRDEIVMG